MPAKKEREEFIFQCTWCKHVFSKKVTRSDIPYVECVRSCVTDKNKAKVNEITDKWTAQKKKRNQQRDKRLAEKPSAEVGVVSPLNARK